MVKKMKITSIQLYEATRGKLEKKKLHPRESYNDVIARMIEEEDIPSMSEMFRLSDGMPQDRAYATDEVIKLSHRLRKRR